MTTQNMIQWQRYRSVCTTSVSISPCRDTAVCKTLRPYVVLSTTTTAYEKPSPDGRLTVFLLQFYQRVPSNSLMLGKRSQWKRTYGKTTQTKLIQTNGGNTKLDNDDIDRIS